MEIAPGFTDTDWKRLTFAGERDWIKGISALRRRLVARFMKPGRSLLRLRWSGFAVLALDSLLVETLQQFVEGEPETPRVRRNGRLVLASEDYFRAFLTGPYFGSGFNDQTARLFYTTVRCGVLHQAEVRASSLVRRDGPLVALTDDGKGVVVNPRLMHSRLEQAFALYVVDLRKRTNVTLRNRFRRKMDHIARVGAAV